MPLPRTPLTIVAGLAAGAALLGAAALATSPAPAPATIAAAPASHDDGAGDVSGPCDEAEHAGDPRCAGSVGTSAPADDRPGASTKTPTSTASPTAATAAPPTGSTGGTIDAAGAGTVTYTSTGTTLTLVSATPRDGWTVEVESAGGHEVDVDFRSGTRRVQVDVELEDGAVRERVRVRDDADGRETRIEDGLVVRTEPSDADHADDDDDSEDRSGSRDDD